MKFSVYIPFFMIMLFVQTYCAYGCDRSITLADRSISSGSLGQKLDNYAGSSDSTGRSISGEDGLRADSLPVGTRHKFIPLYSESVEKDQKSSLYEKILFYYKKANLLFRIILFLNLFFLGSVFVLSIMIFIRRLWDGYIKFKKKKSQNRYRDIITNWLYEEHLQDIPDSLIKELKDPVYRDVFTSELLSLHNNLAGESAEKLVELFYAIGLEKYSIRKAKSILWHVKAKGFREIAQMQIKEGRNLIFRCLNSTNSILRIEAQLAWIQLNPDDPLGFYDDPNVQLTEWGQLNSLLSLKKGGRMPNFRRYLSSPVKRVVLFALKMAGINKQYDNADFIIELLKSDDSEIRHEAICTLGKLAVLTTRSEIEKLFYKENTANKAEIINSLMLMSDNLNIPFFEEVLLKESEINFRILAAKGLVSLGRIGVERLELIERDADPMLKKIIIHAKDDRI